MSAVAAPQPGASVTASPAPPRGLYAVAMLVVAALSTAAAFAAARAIGGAGAVVLQTTALIAAVSLLGLLPVLVSTAERFGLAVLGASMARLLLAMFAAVVLTEVVGVASRPVWFGVVAGAGLGLIAETTIAVAVLSAMERRKTADATGQHGSENRATSLPTHGSENRATTSTTLPEPSTTC